MLRRKEEEDITRDISSLPVSSVVHEMVAWPRGAVAMMVVLVAVHSKISGGGGRCVGLLAPAMQLLPHRGLADATLGGCDRIDGTSARRFWGTEEEKEGSDL